MSRDETFCIESTYTVSLAHVELSIREEVGFAIVHPWFRKYVIRDASLQPGHQFGPFHPTNDDFFAWNLVLPTRHQYYIDVTLT